jgi:hypothetical protein
MAILQVVIVGLLITVGRMAEIGWPYYGGIVVAAGLFVYQQKLIVHRGQGALF